MRITMIAIPAALSATLAMTACNKPASNPKPVVGPAAVSGAGVTAPIRRAGLWEQAMLRDGKPAMGPMGGKLSLCLDADTGAKMGVFGRQMGRGMCQQQSVTRGLDGSYTFASSCTFPGGGRFVSKGAASGDFSSHYVVRSETDVSDAPMERMNGHHTMEMTAVWKGPCPSDMKPGDMVMGNGFKVNVAQMMEHRHGGCAPSSSDGDNN